MRKPRCSIVVDTVVVALIVLAAIFVCSWSAWHQGYNKGYEEGYADNNLGRYYQKHIPTNPSEMSRPGH